MAETATARVQPMTVILSTCALSTSAAHLYSCHRTTAALQVVAHVLYFRDVHYVFATPKREMSSNTIYRKEAPLAGSLMLLNIVLAVSQCMVQCLLSCCMLTLVCKSLCLHKTSTSLTERPVAALDTLSSCRCIMDIELLQPCCLHAIQNNQHGPSDSCMCEHV